MIIFLRIKHYLGKHDENNIGQDVKFWTYTSKRKDCYNRKSGFINKQN